MARPGLHQTPEQIVNAELQEDAQAVGLSIHSGAHMTLFPKVVELLPAAGAEDVIVFDGGRGNRSFRRGARWSEAVR